MRCATNPPAYRTLLKGALVAGVAGYVATAQAHGFGQRYDLPVPLWLYLWGAAAAVAMSFLVMALFARGVRVQTYPRVNLLQWGIGRAIAHPVMLVIYRALALGVFILVITAGLIGVQNPFKNIAPIMIWAIWWVGVAYLSSLLGNFWMLINPANTIFAWIDRICTRAQSDALRTPPLRWPAWLSSWPAVALFLLFAWSELVWEQSDSPKHLVAVVLVYCAITWIGMYAFGRDTWLRHGEVFTAVFSLLSRFAPTEVRVVDPKVCATCGNADCQGECVDCYACLRRAEASGREWNLRPYAAGLLTHRPVHLPVMTLVITLLATVTFDGLIETPLWAGLVEGLQFPAADAPAPPGAGASRTMVYTLGLSGTVALFFCAYLLFCWLIACITRAPATSVAGATQGYSATTIARYFVLTLVPIAIAYHLAHYLSFLVMTWQYLIPMVSDPFGFGWNLFGTAHHFVRIGIVDARAVWYTSVAAIVAGHIAAVVLSHIMASRVFDDPRMATRSQYPMLILMLGYTMLSLWIIAQPITTSGGA
ncbi:MAG: hypothetical protein ACT4PQ_02875 [Betaproteobacteria bacterium]